MFMREREEDSARRGKKDDLGTQLLLLVLKIVLLAGFLFILFQFLFSVTLAGDDSMKPSIREGDIVISYRLKKDYVKDQVILVNYEGVRQVRRVLAVEGDTVDITAEGLLINGSLQVEPDIYTQTLPFTEGVTFPLTVGEGQVFVLGDNRPYAQDSRIYGTVDKKATLGAVFTVIRRRGF